MKAMLGADSVLQSLLNSPGETQVTGSVQFRVLALPLTPGLPSLSLTCIFIFNFLLSSNLPKSLSRAHTRDKLSSPSSKLLISTLNDSGPVLRYFIE